MKLLLVEDSPADARLIREMLKNAAGSFQILQAARLDTALERLCQETFDVVLLDLSLPDSHGLETLARTQKASAGLPILILTGLDDARFALEAVRAGAQDYLVKGQFDGQLLVRTIRYSVERKRAEEEIRRLNAQLEQRVAERTAQLVKANDELVNEIVERKRVEEALRRSQALLAHAGQMARLGAWDLDILDPYVMNTNPNANPLRWSDEVYRIFGYEPGQVEVSNDLFLERTHPADRQRVLDVAAQAIAEKRPYEIEHRIIRPDGIERIVFEHADISFNDRGQPIRMTGAVQDITERKQAEEELAKAKQVAETRMAQLHTMLDSLAEAVYVCDATGRPLLTNPVFVKLTGLDAGSLPQNYEDIAAAFPLFEMNGVPVALSDRPVSVALRGEIVSGRELRLGRPAGEMIVRYNAAPVRDPQGNIIMVVLSIEDITALKQAEQTLIRSEKLAAAGRMAASIAHEVNNPLAAALNAVYLARNDPSVSPQIRETLMLADQELRRAAHITQQTLGFYRESGNRTPVALPKLIDEVLGVYARKLQDRGITVHCRYNCGPCREGCETCFLVNSGEICQVVSNLLANGMDALADHGRIYIRVSRVTNLDGSGQDIHLTIADNGCGIRAENLKRIFEPFFTTKDSIGTGLGLWITQELVRKHNGSIKVRSSKDRGTVFRVSIPAMPAIRNGSTEGAAERTVTQITPAAN